MKNGDYILVKAPNNYTGKLYRNKYCYEHHLIYFNKYGIIPNDTEVIHHIDGNKHNNDISNLELIDKKKHTSNHASGISMVRLICPQCKQTFEIEVRQSFIIKKTKFTFCSRQCSGKYKNINNNIGEDFIIDYFIKK